MPNRLYWWSCPRCTEENKIAWDKCFKCGKNQIEKKQNKPARDIKDAWPDAGRKKARDRYSLIGDSRRIIEHAKQSGQSKEDKSSS